MKKSRNTVLAVLSAAMLLGVIGCTNNNDKSSSSDTSSQTSSDTSSTSSTSDVEKTEITVWTTFNTTYQTIIDNAIQSFEAKYPEYKIKYVKQNGSYDDLRDMVTKGVAAGAYPDLVAAYPDSVADFINTGAALDIEPYMTDPEIGWTEEDFEDIAPAYIEEGQNYFIPGTYSLPICKSTEAMFYNRDILVNLDLSSYDDEINDGMPLTDEYIQNLTWEELFDHLCPAIIAYNEDQDADHKIITPTGKYVDSWAVVGYDSDDNLFITLAEQYGFPYTSINTATGVGSVDFVNDGMKNLMKKFNDAYLKHYFTTKGIVGENVNYLSTTGAMLFSIGSTGGVSYQFSATSPKDVGVAPIPQAEGRDPKVINQGPSIAFLKHGATQAETDKIARGAWLFYKEWTSTEIGIKWAIQTGYSPIRQSVANSPEFLAYCDETSKSPKTVDILTARNAKYAASVMDYLFTSPVFPGSSKARKAVAGLAADCIRNDGKVITDSDLSTYFQNAYTNAVL